MSDDNKDELLSQFQVKHPPRVYDRGLLIFSDVFEICIIPERTEVNNFRSRIFRESRWSGPSSTLSRLIGN